MELFDFSIWTFAFEVSKVARLQGCKSPKLLIGIQLVVAKNLKKINPNWSTGWFRTTVVALKVALKNKRN